MIRLLIAFFCWAALVALAPVAAEAQRMAAAVTVKSSTAVAGTVVSDGRLDVASGANHLSCCHAHCAALHAGPRPGGEVKQRPAAPLAAAARTDLTTTQRTRLLRPPIG